MIIIGEQYFRGVLAAFLGANFMNALITEWQLDMLKEFILHFCEAQIDHSQLSLQEKEEQNIPRCCIKECDLFYERMCR